MPSTFLQLFSKYNVLLSVKFPVEKSDKWPLKKSIFMDDLDDSW